MRAAVESKTHHRPLPLIPEEPSDLVCLRDPALRPKVGKIRLWWRASKDGPTLVPLPPFETRCYAALLRVREVELIPVARIDLIEPAQQSLPFQHAERTAHLRLVIHVSLLDDIVRDFVELDATGHRGELGPA